MIDSPPTDPGQEAFTEHVKACRDLLVDHVVRLLGVPIIGEPAPVRAVTAADVRAARNVVAKAIDVLDQDPDAAQRGPYLLVARQLLVEVSQLLDRLAATGGADARRMRLARRRLHAAVDHLTAVIFAQPDDDPPASPTVD